MSNYNPLVYGLFVVLSFVMLSCGESDQELISPKGEYRQVNLEDGTSIKLGPQSKLIFKPTSNQVNLEGEAIIDIPSTNSLNVLTPNGKVEAFQGEYRIHSRRTTMNVFVLYGDATASNVDGGASRKLSNEMYAIYNGKNLAHNDKKSVDQMSNDKYWVFNSASLRFILESIAAQYAVTFDEGDANLNKVFSGFVPRDDLQIALSIVLRTVGVEYEQDGGNFTLKNSVY